MLLPSATCAFSRHPWHLLLLVLPFSDSACHSWQSMQLLSSPSPLLLDILRGSQLCMDCCLTKSLWCSARMKIWAPSDQFSTSNTKLRLQARIKSRAQDTFLLRVSMQLCSKISDLYKKTFFSLDFVPQDSWFELSIHI